MAHLLRLTSIFVLASLLASCAMENTPATQHAATRSGVKKVRTTAYTHSEGSGGRNAIGGRLSCGRIKSASADWSRYPVGTRFRVVGTGEEYVIDDYGWALVGTNTIDLYKGSRGAMNQWGVRHVDIEVLHWGSETESLKILRPRHKVAPIRRMIASLEKRPG